VSFNCNPSDVVVSDIGPDNDHTAHGTVEKAEGKVIENAQVVLDGKSLKVTIPDASENRGHWVRVTYGVKLDNSNVSDITEYKDNDENVDNNRTVISEKYPNGTKERPSHDGVATTADYQVYVKDIDTGKLPDTPKYGLVANVITVTPPVKTFTVEKVWKDALGNDAPWPEGTNITVELLGNGKPLHEVTTEVLGADKAVDNIAVELSANNAKATFPDVPIYDSITYSVAETDVKGAPEGFKSVVSGSIDEGFTITNVSGSAPGSIVLTATKAINVLNGDAKELEEGQFTFQAKRTAGDADGVDESSFKASTSNDAKGFVSFGEIKFVKPGTYTYEVSESSPSADGFTADPTVYTATFEVTQEGGNLKATQTVKKGDEIAESIAFVNDYDVQPATVDFSGVKTLLPAGSVLTDGQFVFNVAADAGNPVDGFTSALKESATNAADGSIDFGSVTYTKAGTWKYTVTEAPVPEGSGVTGDDTAHAVVVTVADDGKGKLTADVTVDGESKGVIATGLDFTNTQESKEETPAIEKYVNKDVHADLAAFDTVFDYDILAFVTKDADKVEITDELVEGIEFVSAAANVKVADLGASNDHRAIGGTVAEEGAAIEGANVAINGKLLTVAIEDATALRGHWVKVCYKAKLNNNAVTLWDDYLDAKMSVDSNNPVITGIGKHEGVPNTASYKVYVKQEGSDMVGDEPKYELTTNTVTVTPRIQNIDVSKEWQDSTGNAVSWPKDATVTIELLGNGKSLDVLTTDLFGEANAFEKQVVELSESATKGVFESVPVYDSIEYTVTEASVKSSNDGYTASVSGDADKGFTVTNKAKTTTQKSTSSSSSTSSTSPKTGDVLPVTLLALLAGSSAVALGLSVKRRKRDEE